MSEHDLSTLLRDHLADDPPVRRTGVEAIRTARRQTSRRRGLAAGAGALAVAAVAAIGFSVGSGGPERATDVPVANDPGPSLSDQMESKASAAFAPYAGTLGAPRWSIYDVLGETKPAGDPDAQSYRLTYEPAGTLEVHLSVGGYAPAEFELYAMSSTCESQRAENLVSSCSSETLADGSVLVTAVSPRARIGSEHPRVITLAQAAARPPGSVVWVRVVGLSTRDGMAVDASEYVRASDPSTADWKVPVATLRALALDPDLRGAVVAHEPTPGVTPE